MSDRYKEIIGEMAASIWSGNKYETAEECINAAIDIAEQLEISTSII